MSLGHNSACIYELRVIETACTRQLAQDFHMLRHDKIPPWREETDLKPHPLTDEQLAVASYLLKGR